MGVGLTTNSNTTLKIKNCFVKDGSLNIVALKEDIEIYNSSKNYSSARLNSKFDFKYGRIDVKQNSHLQKEHGQLFGP